MSSAASNPFCARRASPARPRRRASPTPTHLRPGATSFLDTLTDWERKEKSLFASDGCARVRPQSGALLLLCTNRRALRRAPSPGGVPEDTCHHARGHATCPCDVAGSRAGCNRHGRGRQRASRAAAPAAPATGAAGRVLPGGVSGRGAGRCRVRGAGGDAAAGLNAAAERGCLRSGGAAALRGAEAGAGAGAGAGIDGRRRSGGGSGAEWRM